MVDEECHMSWIEKIIVGDPSSSVAQVTREKKEKGRKKEKVVTL